MSTGFWIVDALIWGVTGISLALAMNRGLYFWAWYRVEKAKREYDPEANLYDRSGRKLDAEEFAATLKSQQERAAEEAPGPQIRFSGPGANVGMKDMDVTRHPFEEGNINDGQDT